MISQSNETGRILEVRSAKPVIIRPSKTYLTNRLGPISPFGNTGLPVSSQMGLMLNIESILLQVINKEASARCIPGQLLCTFSTFLVNFSLVVQDSHLLPNPNMGASGTEGSRKRCG